MYFLSKCLHELSVMRCSSPCVHLRKPFAHPNLKRICLWFPLSMGSSQPWTLPTEEKWFGAQPPSLELIPSLNGKLYKFNGEVSLVAISQTRP